MFDCMTLDADHHLAVDAEQVQVLAGMHHALRAASGLLQFRRTDVKVVRERRYSASRDNDLFATLRAEERWRAGFVQVLQAGQAKGVLTGE
jgi:hypothetical protein